MAAPVNKWCEATKVAQTGWSLTDNISVSDHPVRSASEWELLLGVAATPPQEEGINGSTQHHGVPPGCVPRGPINDGAGVDVGAGEFESMKPSGNCGNGGVSPAVNGFTKLGVITTSNSELLF